jgi:uncharacterized membrane protein
MVTVRLLESLTAIMQLCSNASRLEVLRNHADRIHQTAERHYDNADDLEQTTRRYTTCLDAYRNRSAAGTGHVCGASYDNLNGPVAG